MSKTNKPSKAQAHRNECHAAFNRGYHDAINARAPQDADFYYMMGHEEGWPKRLVNTYVMTANGPVRERCTIERASYLLSLNTRTGK